ncbi:MAG: hypothetical protein NTU94_08915 [Planctomycetota bacterium]|nr:hypothetical protein [Planctomycetota bacterium]
MAVSAAGWMKSSGMAVKSEFVTPWGICDLVGLSFNLGNVAHRLQLKQTRGVSTITSAVLLLHIPDVETKKSTTLDKLVRQCLPSIPEEVVCKETNRLIADRFVLCSSRGRLQKVNGWMPLQDRLVAIELKLSRIDEGMRQAMNNLGFAEESYVGLPTEVARRVASHASRWSDFFDAGVGLLSVARHGCKVLVPARQTKNWTDTAIQFYCVEKFWRTRIRGS